MLLPTLPSRGNSHTPSYTTGADLECYGMWFKTTSRGIHCRVPGLTRCHTHFAHSHAECTLYPHQDMPRPSLTILLPDYIITGHMHSFRTSQTVSHMTHECLYCHMTHECLYCHMTHECLYCHMTHECLYCHMTYYIVT